jgi:prolipoprotein diacylglyceryl transferase
MAVAPLLGSVPALVASIPSPSSGQIHLGPLRLTAYGLMIALGVLAAVEIARRRIAARGGDPDDISAVAVWAVAAGLIGARIYHVLTDLERFRGHWLDTVKVWEGGLGIPGGLIAGIGVGVLVARRRGVRMSDALDIAAPALPVAQAIGRWGNWWNQELFGRPTSLPWGLEIDPAHRPPGYEDHATYHPAFLYECLWNLALAGFLVWFDRRYPRRLRPGSLFAMYVAGYGLGRLWVELLRIDPAQKVAGIRFNVLMSVAAIVGGLGYLLLWGRRPSAGPEDGSADPPDGPAAQVAAVEPSPPAEMTGAATTSTATSTSTSASTSSPTSASASASAGPEPGDGGSGRAHPDA